VRRLISISGGDAGEAAGELFADPSAARKMYSGIVHFGPPSPGDVSPVRVVDFDAEVEALKKSGNIYNLQDTAPGVADRSILLIGAWEDTNVTVDHTVLPYYRALKKAKANDVTFLVYHTDHWYGSVSRHLASDIRQWLGR